MLTVFVLRVTLLKVIVQSIFWGEMMQGKGLTGVQLPNSTVPLNFAPETRVVCKGMKSCQVGSL